MVLHFRKSMILLVLVGLIVVLSGCSRDKQEKGAEEPEVPVAAKPVPPAIMDSLQGKVLEVVDTGSFIFIRLDQGKKEIWATVPTVEVRVGEKVTLLSANILKKFRSTTMNRTFDELVFAAGIEGKATGKRIAMPPREVITDNSPTSAGK